jgi:8-oxo-dGTP diphosphatase
MSRQIPVTLTNMCMVYDSDKVLVQNRVDPDWPGITFPGGHVESGESFCASVIREVFEETGLTIENPRLCGVKEWENQDGSRYIVLFYKTNQFSGQLKSSEEGKVFWSTVESLPSLKLSLDFQQHFELFFNDELSEAFYENTSLGWKLHLL